METLPKVTLDTTLAELYVKNAPNGRRHRIAILPCGWASGVDLGPGMPRNRKLIFQEPVTMAAYRDASQFQSQEAIRDMQIKFLSLVSQRDGFAAGDMGVVMFTFDQSDGLELDVCASTLEARQTMSQIAPNQQPQLLFCRNPDEVPECLQRGQIDLTLPKLPLDCLEQVPLTCSIEASYYLHSKTGLAESGLPTPKSTVIAPPAFYDTSKWRQEAQSHLFFHVAARNPPFVLKTNQSGGGGGAFIIHDRTKLDSTLKDFSSFILPHLLTATTSSNAHLAPANIVIQDYVPKTTGNWGLTFFLSASGTCTFLSAPTQHLSSDGVHWLGNHISWPEQGDLEKKLTPLMHRIGGWLRKHGYYGPVGADVLETEKGELLVVDVNSRIPGSWTISLMRGFFEKERGFHEACSQFVNVKMPRKDFVEHDELERFFHQGRVVIVSWYWDEQKGISYASLIVAGETKEDMESVLGKCMEFAEEFHV